MRAAEDSLARRLALASIAPSRARLPARMRSPGPALRGSRLAREGLAVDKGFPLHDEAVEGHPLAWEDEEGVLHRGFLGGEEDPGRVAPNAGFVRPEGEEAADRGSAAGGGRLLEGLADLIEDHDAHGLGVLAYGDGAEGGYAHEEELVEDAAAQDVPPGTQEDVPPREEIGGDIEEGRGEGSPSPQAEAFEGSGRLGQGRDEGGGEGEEGRSHEEADLAPDRGLEDPFGARGGLCIPGATRLALVTAGGAGGGEGG